MCTDCVIISDEKFMTENEKLSNYEVDEGKTTKLLHGMSTSLKFMSGSKK